MICTFDSFDIFASFPDSILLFTKKAMTELLLDAVLQVLFEKLLSPEFLNFARRYEGLGEKLGKWRKMLSRIQVVLDDAEEK